MKTRVFHASHRRTDGLQPEDRTEVFSDGRTSASLSFQTIEPLDAHQGHVIAMSNKGMSVKSIYAALTQDFDYQGTCGAVRIFV